MDRNGLLIEVVLSKLRVAAQGPSRALTVVRSLRKCLSALLMHYVTY